MYGDSVEEALLELESIPMLTLSTSMDLASYEINLALAKRCELMVPLFGVHPWKAAENAHRLDEFCDALDRTPAIGEIGLDHRFVEDESLYPAQQDVFEFMLEAAAARGKSVNLHTAGAEAAVLHLLDKHGVERVVVHWYTGPDDTFHALAERGAYFTFGVGLLHIERVRRLAAAVPEELILTETDNPGGLEWMTGEPGPPRVIRDVVDALAEARDTSVGHVIETVERNFEALLARDPQLRAACARAIQAVRVREGRANRGRSS